MSRAAWEGWGQGPLGYFSLPLAFAAWLGRAYNHAKGRRGRRGSFSE